MINVLYICHAPDNLGGASLSLLNLINSVKDSVNCQVVLGKEGVVSKCFRENGIECIIADFPYNIRNRNYFIHVITFPLKFMVYLIKTRLAILKIKQSLCGKKIDIVHSNSSVFVFGDVLAKSLRAKHIWHFREFQDIDFNMRPFLGMCDLKRRMHRSDALIAITKAVYDHWHLGEYPNSMYVWDAVRSAKDCAMQINKEKYFLFCAALLSKAKGVDCSLRAFGLSGMTKQGFKLKIIGVCKSETLKSELSNITKYYNIEDSVEYLGYQANIKPYMEKATAFLMTSVNEGLGRVTIEAMFYGCLVVARHTGGTLEFLKNGYNGLYFDNDEQLSKILIKVSNKTPIEIINNALKFAIENFSEERYGVRIKRLYSSLFSD